MADLNRDTSDVDLGQGTVGNVLKTLVDHDWITWQRPAERSPQLSSWTGPTPDDRRYARCSPEAPRRNNPRNDEQAMVKNRTKAWQFTNRWGEKWIFEYDCTAGKGVLKGSDVDWESYSVVEGRAPELVLNNEEILWLRKAWAEAVNG